MNERTKLMYWTYGPDFELKQNLQDPRIAIARQLGWQKYYNECTEYATPEPDNYNRAIWNLLPVDCKIADFQVIYKDHHNDAWFTVMYIPEEKIEEYQAWLSVFNPKAHWQHEDAPAIKARRYA